MTDFEMMQTPRHPRATSGLDPRYPVEIDLMPFFDGGKQLDEIVKRALFLKWGSSVKTGERGPGSLHIGEMAGLNYYVYNGKAVQEHFPEIWHLYRNAATECLRYYSGMMGLMPLDGERGVNINITKEGHAHEWHVAGPDIESTSSTGLQVYGESCKFLYHDGKDVQSTAIKRGKMTTLPGACPHAVEEVPENCQRITLIMAWTLEGSEPSGLDDYLYRGE